jgi:hypothetical protein
MRNIHHRIPKGLYRRTLIAATLLPTLLVMPAHAQTELPAMESIAASTPEATLDKVLVTGEQAGPGLWKISKGDHVLWIFGSYAPLPKKMTWRSKEVESIIADSQEFITPTAVDMDIGFFSGLALLPSMIGLRNNPHGMLKDVMPPDLYSRWLAQKEKYIGRDKAIEKWRPFFAAAEIYSKSVEKAGFEGGTMPPSDELQKQIEKLARKHKVKITRPTVEIKVPKARAWVKEVKQASLDDLTCFSKTIALLETDMDQFRVRANAWAVGNVQALRAQTAVEQQEDACTAAFFNILQLPGGQERGFSNIPTRAVDTWVAAAELALANNASTFAVLSVDEIFWAEGSVEKLRAKGYTVEEP